MTTGGTTLKNFIWNRFTRFVDAISQAHTFHAHFSLLFTIGAMTFATALSLFFHQITPTGSANIALIYILTIIMISYHTDKYRYGIISGIISVFFINYMFTYPFGQFSFSTAGYPFTFAVMYFISILSSATVFRMKDQAQKINETEKLLAEAEKEKLRANLLRAVSHDLRTPLTSMIGASSSYLENESTLSSPEKRDLVSHIYEDANWLLHMVENLLSVTRITDGISNTLKETPEVAEEVLFDAVSTIRKRYPDYQIQVSVPGDFYVVPMDPLLIKQVIINLLENAYYIITPGGEVALEKISDFTELISSLGAIPLVITAEEHDFITAGVSHLPHIVASALVNLVNLLDNDAQYMKMIAAGGFRDITRIASSSPVMWEQICLENQKNISTVLDEFIRMLIQIRCSIDNKEADNIFDMFASSKDYRDSIDIVDNSLIPRSYVLYIDVADEAGAIATIATILATEKVSIKNIGIIHNREFEDGVLKIEFYTDAALEQAKVLLTKRNYKICER
mgnify:CR=1 FL=1